MCIRDRYLSLRKLGWSADRLRIVVLTHHGRGELHAVLVAYHNGTAYVLDNLLDQVAEHTALGDYQPIYSINENSWFRHHGWTAGARAYRVSTYRGGAVPRIAASRRTALRPRPSYAGTAQESTADLFNRPSAHN